MNRVIKGRKDKRSRKNVKHYQLKNCKLSGTSYTEIYRNAWQIYLKEKKKSRRRPYIRSAYFRKDKIFIDIFWRHLKEKHHRERSRRLKFYGCAIDLLKKSRVKPMVVKNPNKANERLYRFYGEATNSEIFIVQIKENLKDGQKYFISVFPG